MFSFDHNVSEEAVSELRDLVSGMRQAYARGENAMEFARARLGRKDNHGLATLIAYDLQAGEYVRHAMKDPDAKRRWCAQLATLISPLLPGGGTVMEAGCGEATTLAGVLTTLPKKPSVALGFDISWSRCTHGVGWLRRMQQRADLFVADLFHIPLCDDSVDVVYTSHSIEPNGGREEAALRDLLRVARRAVVLVEPIYELASADSQARMDQHGYVRNLRAVAEATGCRVTDYRLLDYCVNPLNPSGVVLIEKSSGENTPGTSSMQWRCPLTHTALTPGDAAFVSRDTGFVYPVLGGIPLLSRDHAVIASAYEALPNL